jgi:hypothetical protein
VRGPGGGYRLARGMNGVTVADIIAAVDEPLDATNCGGRENCHRRAALHDPRPVDQPEQAHARVPGLGLAGRPGQPAQGQGGRGDSRIAMDDSACAVARRDKVAVSA